MPSEYKLDQLFIDIAYRVSCMSHDTERQVGAIIIKDGNILSIGYNGMPSGMSNNCKDNKGSTNKEVIHAEANAIVDAAYQGKSTAGMALAITHPPCADCAGIIIQAGITSIIYEATGDDMERHNGQVALTLFKEALIKIKGVTLC